MAVIKPANGRSIQSANSYPFFKNSINQELGLAVGRDQVLFVFEAYTILLIGVLAGFS
jgi:hypothetical protein